MIRFDGRVAVVTGAGRGLGRAYAMALAERGCAVVVNDLAEGEDDAAAEVVAAIAARGARVALHRGSVADPTAARALVATAVAEFGRIDIVVNNAGILRDRTFAKTDLADFALVVGVHLLGSAHVTHAAWPYMTAGGYGRVIMTSSHAGLFGNFGQASYAAAKLGLIGLAATLAQEGARHGIRVNSIVPLAGTRMMDGTHLAPIAPRLPPEDVVPAVLWLASEACNVGGQTLVAGGGRFAVARMTESAGVRMSGATAEQFAGAAADILEGRSLRGFPDAAHAVTAALEGWTASP